MRAAFVFTLCQLGAEPALKREIARLEPSWRPAFSRPGLVTFKTPAPLSASFALPAVFARAYGLSLGAAADAAAACALLAPLSGGRVPWLHVSERDRALPGQGETSYGALAAEVERALAARGLRGAAGPPTVGGLVVDVIAAPDEPLLVGVHEHHANHSRFAGGRPPVSLPPEAPSRAYLKLEEALAWSQVVLAPGQVAVEIGSAPGGASFALLERGLTVVGVDPGDMAPQVLASPRFTHLRTTLGDVRREQLPARVDWLLMDVNLAPQVALHGIRRLAQLLGASLRGVIFTLKLNDWAMADELPDLIGRVAAIRAGGFERVRATQLPANRREICVVGDGMP